MVTRVRHLWLSIKEPRRLKAVFFLAYLVTLYIGIVTLLSPPASIESQIGPLLSLLWSLFLIICGLIGALAVFPGWWKTERLALWCGYFGLGIYAAVVLVLHFSASGSRLTQIGVIVLASFVYTLRFLLIRKGDFEPRS